MNEEEKMVKETQKILNRLISEEVVAANLYNGSISSVKPEQAVLIAKKFKEIADDEIDDHWASLVKFANANGFEVPFKMKDIQKHASKKMVSAVENLKLRQDAAYYIEKAVEGEVEAIKSFEEAINGGNYPVELQPILYKCYYDEIQHLDDLELLKSCAALGVEAKWGF